MPEQIFDRTLLTKRRTRFANKLPAHDFLLQRAGEDIQQRLGAVMRDFDVSVNLGAHHGLLTQILKKNTRCTHIISTDLCEPLIAQSEGHRIVCDEECLPFKAQSLDLLVSGLTLHMVNDLPGSLVQIRRALKPDGLFLAAVLGGRSLSELREAMAVAEEDIDGGVSPRVSPFADIRDYGALLLRAGFALPVTDSDMVSVTYATALDLMRDIQGMGASNVLSERRKTPLKRSVLMRAAQIYAEKFPAENGRISATFEIIHLTGWSPDASQPKPLAPGSARKRLSDALGAQEHSTGEKANPTGKP